MTVGDLITGDWQIERNGLLIGDTTEFDVRSMSGLASAASVRSQDRELVFRHGAVPGLDYLSPRSINMRLEIVADDAGTLGAKLDTLNLAFAPTNSEVTMAFQIPGVAGGNKAQVLARVRRRDVPIDMEFNRGLGKVLLDLVCTDPRIYSQKLHTGSAVLPSASNGLTFDIGSSMTFGGSNSSGGSITLTNAGNFQSDPVFRINGPCIDPVIESLAEDKKMEFDIELTSSQFLEIDCANRTVLLGGTASRYSTLSSDSSWLTIEPGSTEVTFRAFNQTTATLEAFWRDAWS